MRVVGITGLSGSGKSSAAGIIARRLSEIGWRVALDGFGAPIKWLCLARGWDGRRDGRWRRVMQALAVESRRTDGWFETVRHKFADNAAVKCLEMAALEQIALDHGVDKFVMWLASRNVFCPVYSPRGWYESLPGRFQARPDFLIVHDVRYPAEADFCLDQGALIHKEGSARGLPEDMAGHESESHVAELAGRASMAIGALPDAGGLEEAASAAVDWIVRRFGAERRDVLV